MSSQTTLTKSDKPRKVLTEEQKNFIYDQLSQFKSTTEIRNALKEVWGVETSISNIWNIRDRGKFTPEQIKRRRKYLNEMSDVPIFHPRVRLDRYELLYNMSLEDGDRRGMGDALTLAQNEFSKKIGGDTYNQMLFVNQDADMTLEEVRARKEYWLKKLKPKQEVIDVNGPDRPTEG